MQATIQQLNDQYAIDGHVHFEIQPGGLAAAVVENALASGCMTLAGAQVMRYQRRAPHAMPLLWVSPTAANVIGGEMRGGAPLCWPWFGPHPTRPDDQPLHGLVRTMTWEVSGTRGLDDGATEITMRVASTAETLARWPHAFALEMRAVFGTRLRLKWTARNPGSTPYTYTGAIHPYYAVSDARGVTISGLEHCDYMDKNDGYRRKTQPGSPIEVLAPLDWVFVDTTGEVAINDPGWKRRLRIAKSGSRTTVVWNPHDADALMADVGAGQHRLFVCAEAANAFEDAVTLAPGAEARLSMEIWAEELEA